MIPNIHQSIDEIIRSASPAQRVLWQHARLITGENAAVQQYVYIGTIAAAADLLTFVQGKLFLALELTFTGTTGQASGSVGYANLADANNAVCFYMANNSMSFDTVGAAQQYSMKKSTEYNIVFGRIVNYNFTYVKFIGYKITA